MSKHRALRIISALGLFGLAATGAQAQSPESFYRGRTVSIYIGFGGGGSYDFYGHLIARHISKLPAPLLRSAGSPPPIR